MLRNLLPLTASLLFFHVAQPALKAQVDTSSGKNARIVIKSYSDNGLKRVEHSVERMLGSEEDMGFIVDSILRNLGMDVGDIRQIKHMGESMKILFQDAGPSFDSLSGSIREWRFEDLSILEHLDLSSIADENTSAWLQLMNRRPTAYLGVVFEDVVNEDSEVPFKKGIIVSKVSEGSPAEAAGLAANDIIIMVDDTEITNIAALQQVISTKTPGDKVKIIYQRDESILETVAVLKARKPSGEMWSQNPFDEQALSNAGLPRCDKIIIQKGGPKLGISVADLDQEAKKALKVKSGGAMVTKVERHSCAELMKLQVNDVITHINQQTVNSAAQLKELVRLMPIGSEVSVGYVRYGKKKTASGELQQFSRAWEEQIPVNIIDFTATELQQMEHLFKQMEQQLELMDRRSRRRLQSAD
jgi:hypothetical protein